MFGLAIHGGAGTLPRAEMSAEREAEYRAALAAALTAGFAVLDDAGTSLDAVTQAVCVLEDDPLFNAGPRRRVHARRAQRAGRLHHGRRDPRGRGGLRRDPHQESHRARARRDGALRIRLARAARARRSSPRAADSNSCRRLFLYRRTLAPARTHSRRRRGRLAADHLPRGHRRRGGARRARPARGGHLDGRHDGQALSDASATHRIIGAGTYADDRAVRYRRPDTARCSSVPRSRTTSARACASAGEPRTRPCTKWCIEELPAIGGEGGVIAIDRSRRDRHGVQFGGHVPRQPRAGEERENRHLSRGLTPLGRAQADSAAAPLEPAGAQRVVLGFHHHDPISALLLGAVQGLVRELDQASGSGWLPGSMNAAPMLTVSRLATRDASWGC